MRPWRSVSVPQVIAILSGVAAPTALQAATQLAGLSLGRLGWGLRRGRSGERSRRGGSSPGNTACARWQPVSTLAQSSRPSGGLALQPRDGVGEFLGSKLCSCGHHLSQEKLSKKKKTKPQTKKQKKKRHSSRPSLTHLYKPKTLSRKG